jgi:hypothetical protein
MAGGFDAWVAAGKPVVKPLQPSFEYSGLNSHHWIDPVFDMNFFPPAPQFHGIFLIETKKPLARGACA